MAIKTYSFHFLREASGSRASVLGPSHMLGETLFAYSAHTQSGSLSGRGIAGCGSSRAHCFGWIIPNMGVHERVSFPLSGKSKVAQLDKGRLVVRQERVVQL